MTNESEQPSHTDIRDLIHEHNTQVIIELGKQTTSIATLSGKVDVIATKQDDLRRSVDENIDSIKSLEKSNTIRDDWMKDQRRALSWGRKMIFALVAIGGFLIAAFEFTKRQYF